MHKKNAVHKEKWMRFGDWFMHPDFNKRKKSLWGYNSGRDLAHQCKDGNVSSVVGYDLYKSKRTGLIKVYGKCRKCGIAIGKEIDTIVNLLKTF